MSLSETPLQPAMIASGEAEAGGVLTVDLAAIAANWKRLYGMTAPVECAAECRQEFAVLRRDPRFDNLAHNEQQLAAPYYHA